MNKTTITKVVTIAGSVFTANAEAALNALRGNGELVRDNTGAYVFINSECCPAVSVVENSVTTPIVLNPLVC